MLVILTKNQTENKRQRWTGRKGKGRDGKSRVLTKGTGRDGKLKELTGNDETRREAMALKERRKEGKEGSAGYLMDKVRNS